MSARFEHFLDLIDAAAKADPGYGQDDRWSWLDKAGKRILPGREADCSAMTIGLAWLAGYPVPTANIANPNATCFTGNADELLGPRGGGFHLRDVRGQSVAAIEASTGPGDILLGDGHIMVKARRGLWFSMNQDEHGRAIGGAPGDQTGVESSFRPLWARHGGWLTVFTAPDKAASTPAKTAPASTSTTLAQGSSGASVKALQSEMSRVFFYAKTTPDGVFGPKTAAAVREFQKRYGHGLAQDGVVGPVTLAALRACGCKL